MSNVIFSIAIELSLSKPNMSFAIMSIKLPARTDRRAAKITSNQTMNSLARSLSRVTN